MSNAAPKTCGGLGSDSGASLDLRAEYEPDDERAARALLLILGLQPDEIERVVAEMSLESDREM